MHLSDITHPNQLRNLNLSQLRSLARQIRDKHLQTAANSPVGCHLGPGLGVVELTLALYKTLDLDRDKVIWDVGHQAYAHKMLTGRYHNFHTLRQKGGISGYLKRSDIRIPERGSVYSLNEGYFCQWSEGIQNYVRYVHRRDGYISRYSGALVADFHRILLQGGVYLYPGTQKKPEGKLRLMYEANPLAFLAEQAGGAATTGTEAILDIVPQSLHQRVPLIIGSRENVEEVLRCLEGSLVP